MIIWLASYPKSGNTWVRSFIVSLLYSEDNKANLNNLSFIPQYPLRSHFKNLVNDKISIADLAVWRLLGWLSSGLLDGVPNNVLDPYTKLVSMRKAVYQHPKVNEWMLTKYNKII